MAVAAGTVGNRFGDVHWFEEIDSTNVWVAAEARRGAPEGLVAVADVQTAGRGRLDRRWVAPPGSGLLCSVLVRPNIPPDRLHLVSFAMALAVLDALAARVGAAVALKWPNDVIVPSHAERKLTGILAEAVDGAVVVGAGMNVVRPEVVDPEVAGRAVWLSELGTAPDRGELLIALLRAFADRVVQLEGVPAAMLADYRASCVTIGRRVRVELPGGGLDGIAVDLDASAALVVRDDAGRCHVVSAGDVVHASLA